jgi:steroid delta-isomerase-like uncharacterized protein
MDHTISMKRIYELLSAGDLEGFSQHVADDFIEHDEIPGVPPTKDGLMLYFEMMLTAFPDMRMDVKDVIVSGDKAVARVQVSGTHSGEFMGIPATDKSFEVNLIDIMRFGEDGLAHEHWGVVDQLLMMQQLGIIPAMG